MTPNKHISAIAVLLVMLGGCITTKDKPVKKIAFPFYGGELHRSYGNFQIVKEISVKAVDKSTVDYALGTVSLSGEITLKKATDLSKFYFVIFRDGDMYARNLDGRMYDNYLEYIYVGIDGSGITFSKLEYKIHLIDGRNLPERDIDRERTNDYYIVALSFRPEGQSWYHDSYKISKAPIKKDQVRPSYSLFEEGDGMMHDDVYAYSGIGQSVDGGSYHLFDEDMKGGDGYDPLLCVYLSGYGGYRYGYGRGKKANQGSIREYLLDFKLGMKLVIFSVSDFSIFLDEIAEISEINEKKAVEMKKKILPSAEK